MRGDYVLGIQAGQGFARVSLGGRHFVQAGGPDANLGRIHLEKGQPVTLDVEYGQQAGRKPEARLIWAPANDAASIWHRVAARRSSFTCKAMTSAWSPMQGTSSTDSPRWLVIRNQHRQALEYQELWPGADLRRALDTERARRAADGWHVEDIPSNCAFCFADRGHERVCISIECFEPGTAGLR